MFEAGFQVAVRPSRTSRTPSSFQNHHGTNSNTTGFRVSVNRKASVYQLEGARTTGPPRVSRSSHVAGRWNPNRLASQ